MLTCWQSKGKEQFIFSLTIVCVLIKLTNRLLENVRFHSIRVSCYRYYLYLQAVIKSLNKNDILLILCLSLHLLYMHLCMVNTLVRQRCAQTVMISLYSEFPISPCMLKEYDRTDPPQLLYMLFNVTSYMQKLILI